MISPEEQRATLAGFQSLMTAVLEANMHKDGWDRDTPSDLFKRVHEELREVSDAMLVYGTKQFDLLHLERECADVANMIMMVADRIRRMIDESKIFNSPQESRHLFLPPNFHEYWRKVQAAMEQVDAAGS